MQIGILKELLRGDFNNNFFILCVILNQRTPRYAFFVCLENEEILSV